MDNFSSLTKKEKKELKNKLQQEELSKTRRVNLIKKIIVYTLLFLLVLALLYWLIKAVTSPQPGTAVADQGREHVTPGAKVDYSSNPPTSGPHFESWEKSGIYDQPLADGKLVHSLEHGYIIVSYNCDYAKKSFLPSLSVYAHVEEENTASPSSTSDESSHLDLSKWNEDKNCQELVSELTEFAKKMRLWKLIVVPRPTLDSRIALTAWTRIDKLDAFQEKRVTDFINAYRDRGPEKTME